jgi:hypothetical protein
MKDGPFPVPSCKEMPHPGFMNKNWICLSVHILLVVDLRDSDILAIQPETY